MTRKLVSTILLIICAIPMAAIPSRASAQSVRPDEDARFIALAYEVRDHLSRHELDAAQNSLTRLARIPVRLDEFDGIASDVASYEARVAEHLALAEELRVAGDYTGAIRETVRAEGFAADRPSLPKQRRALQNEQHALESIDVGDIAMIAGEFDEAIAAYERALDRQSGQDVQDRLDDAREAKFRIALDGALRADDLPAAIKTARNWQRVRPTEERAQLLSQLRAEYVGEALRAAQLAFSEGRLASAISKLEAALTVTESADITQELGAYRSQRLVEQAVGAERAGDALTARDLYLQALAITPSLPGIAERVDDTQSVARFQEQARAAELKAAEADRRASYYEGDLRRSEDAFREIDDEYRRVVRDAGALEATVHTLARKLDYEEHRSHDLQRENDRLRDQIRRLERDLRDARRHRDRDRDRGRDHDR
jgi:tetratricopeptide (TPR) repeat protein